MSNPYKEREQGQEAERILKSPVWVEAWEAYRLRILELIEAAGSSDTDSVMHLKRLLKSGQDAKSHLERIMSEGAYAAKMIEIEEKRGRLERLFKGH